jgi:hypothetical protein
MAPYTKNREKIYTTQWQSGATRPLAPVLVNVCIHKQNEKRKSGGAGNGRATPIRFTIVELAACLLSKQN